LFACLNGRTSAKPLHRDETDASLPLWASAQLFGACSSQLYYEAVLCCFPAQVIKFRAAAVAATTRTTGTTRRG